VPDGHKCPYGFRLRRFSNRDANSERVESDGAPGCTSYHLSSLVLSRLPKSQVSPPPRW